MYDGAFVQRNDRTMLYSGDATYCLTRSFASNSEDGETVNANSPY